MITVETELAHPVHQARSARTREAILRAGRNLLTKKDFAGVTVAEIARGAKCSVGGFYARFSNKETMLRVLEQQILDELADDLEAKLAHVDAAGKGIQDLVSVYIRTMVARFREHLPILKAVVRRSREPGRIQPHVRRFNVRIHDALLERILARRDEITHPDPESAAVLGLFFASASAREAMLGGKLEVYRHQVSDEALATELIRAYLAFLGVRWDRGEG